MTNTNKFLQAIILSTAILTAAISKVQANSYGQDTVCTGSYGQVVECGSVKGATTDKVVYLAETALDTPTLLAVGAIFLSGVGAVVLKKRI